MIMHEPCSYSAHGYSREHCNRCKRADTYESRIIRLARIEALLVIAAAILVFLGVFGSFRRRWGNRAFELVGFGAYYAPFCISHFPIWATYLVVVLGSADSYNAHSIEDIEQWKSFNMDSAAKCFMTSWMIASYVTPPVPIFCTVFLFVILFVKLDERERALMLASNSVMQKKYKSIADYMSTENLPKDEDPASMHGYRYLVRVAEQPKVHLLCSTAMCRQKEARWQAGAAPHYRQLLQMTDEDITIEMVWRCEGRLLTVSGGQGGRLKDLCLFNFICLRFAGYSLPQEAHDKVIEVELAFLFDLFYTKYPVNLNLCRSVYKLIQLAIVVGAALISLPFVAWPQQHDESKAEDLELYPSYTGFFITILFMMSILAVEFTQFGIMIFSEWAKWWQRNTYAAKLIEIMCRVQLLKPWGRQLRQYSLLQSYCYSPHKWIHNRFTTAYLNPKRNVKKAIALSLRKNYLDNWGERQFSWACNLETTTHVIMVWHIATTFCEHKEPPSQESRDNFVVATTLSKYLAYLVAFAPRLLPGHPCRTEYIFDCAVSEASKLFEGSSVSMYDRIEKLNKLDAIEDETIVGRGAKLGQMLVRVAAPEKPIWKVLANFWTEMMLYVAPSKNAAAHAKYLATGGEFLTHVWVLVSHAGITRDPLGGDDPEWS
ncbi:hypothetical protein ACJRO7_017115 [Eucalyptus globulus]|uniref:DUF4220 domain-containing protein n=1 Tax=Eucalyptus globulus TaxID=34317 RepID=A0ABD3KQF1_EUCGL